MRGVMFIGVLTAGLGLAAASIAPAFSQTARSGRATTAASVGEGAKAQESNEWTVGVAGGLLEGTNIRFAAEMAKVLDDRPNLRVLPMVTYGALGNVEDLLYLKGVDITITSADVLDEFVRNGTLAHIKERIRFICKFFINDSIALEKMRTGEIAGVVHVTGKPTDLFTKFKPEPGFHFLTVPFSKNLQDYYV